ncbi:MAG: DUF4423 domain-containing protein [Pseudomonadota bacterium]|nr:DUF4423 domain-containing protein [Pseudomonadota bacterium]
MTDKILKREKPNEVQETQRTLYYSSWLYSAIHILTSIPTFQVAPAIAEKLHLPVNAVINALRDLVEMNLVQKEKEKYIHAGKDIYLPSEHPQCHSHHLNWRIRAVERAMIKEDVHYSNVFSISKKDLEILRQQVVAFIEEQRKQVRASGTDIACVFCCDFFTL